MALESQLDILFYNQRTAHISNRRKPVVGELTKVFDIYRMIIYRENKCSHYYHTLATIDASSIRRYLTSSYGNPERKAFNLSTSTDLSQTDQQLPLFHTFSFYGFSCLQSTTVQKY